MSRDKQLTNIIFIWKLQRLFFKSPVKILHKQRGVSLKHETSVLTFCQLDMLKNIKYQIASFNYFMRAYYKEKHAHNFREQPELPFTIKTTHWFFITKRAKMDTRTVRLGLRNPISENFKKWIPLMNHTSKVTKSVCCNTLSCCQYKLIKTVWNTYLLCPWLLQMTSESEVAENAANWCVQKFHHF